MTETRDLSMFVKRDTKGIAHMELAVEGVGCAGCIRKIEHGLKQLPGVTDARLNFTNRRLAVDWHDKAVMLFGSGLASSDMQELAAKGAAVGTVEKMEGFAGNRFAVEGHRSAVREMRKFLKAAGATALQLNTGKKPLYAAGLAFAGTLFTPLVEAAVDCLRKSGISSQDAVEFAEACFLHTLRAYVKAGKQGWQGPVAKRDIEAVRRLMFALGEDNPLLVSYFAQTARMALDVFGKDKDWLDEMDLYPPPTPTAQGVGLKE